MAKVPITDIDRFIELVKARPALYNKADPGYKNLNKKHKLWSQICNELLYNWPQLDAKTKLRIMHEVQQKWLNLRTCFSRDINSHRKAMAKSPATAHKRHRYLHYKKLLFLLPKSEYAHSITPKIEDAGDGKVDEAGEKVDFEDEMNVFEEADDADNYIEEIPAEIASTSATNGVNGRFRTRNEEGDDAYNDVDENDDDDDFNNDPSIVPIPDVRLPSENIDENVNFVLSLVPALRSLNEEQQFDAKIEIMRVLKDIKFKR